MKDLVLINLPAPGNPVAPKFNDIEVLTPEVLERRGFEPDEALTLATWDLETVDGTPRKTQEIIKILLTRVGSNPVYPTYGSQLPNVFGQRATPRVNDIILESIIKALGFVQAIETSSEPSERVKRIVNLYVVDGDDPRTKVIRLLVEMEDGSIADTSVPMVLGV